MNIVITGAGEGLGKTIAKRLAPKHKVIIVDIDENKASETAKELSCEYKVCDVSDAAAVKTAISQIEEEHGQIDVLVNNAGIWIQGKLQDSDDERAQQVFNVNCLGTIYVTKYALPKMLELNQGTIINIVSTAGVAAKTERSIYNASKWAMTGFTKCMQEEVKGTNIRVMGMYPSFMNTTLFKNAGNDRDNYDLAMDPDELAKTIEFILTLDPTTSLTEVGIRNIKY